MAKNSLQLAVENLVYTLGQHPELMEGAQRIGFLRALPHAGLEPWKEITVCDQPFKPRLHLLEDAGWKTKEDFTGPFDVIWLLPERQREQTYHDFAMAMDALRDDGVLIVSIHNDWGSKRWEDNLIELAGSGETATKNHCRTFWVRKTEELDTDLLAEWRGMASLQRILDGKYWSKPGLFAWDHIDPASAMLVDTLPMKELSGYVADLGSGWGYLSTQIMEHAENVIGLDAYEAERDGYEATRRNIGNVKARCRARAWWQDVKQGVGERRYDFVVMNPPFHESREADPMLGMKFITAAARALKPTGRLWVVANVHLPYEEALEDVFDSVAKVREENGFKIHMAAMPRQDLFNRRDRRERYKPKW